MSYNAARAKIMRALKEVQLRRSGIQLGDASSQWEKWDVTQRQHFLRVWCHLAKPQILHFCKLPWFSLSLHVRKSVKKFFSQTPVVDKILGEMRYPPKENSHTTPSRLEL